ncbi:hypothetical protein JCM3774_006629 [Rhodotorula dairenensis]
MAAFLSVTEFLDDSTKLPCRVAFDIPNTGHLEGAAEKDLRANTSLELPYWLAQKMADQDIVDLTMPRAYAPQVRHALRASPTALNLRNLGGGGGSFYSGGIRLLHLVEDTELAAILEASFKTRLIEIMDQSQHSLADHGGEGAAYEFAQGLDSWEKELFIAGETSARQIKTWFDAKGKKR